MKRTVNDKRNHSSPEGVEFQSEPIQPLRGCCWGWYIFPRTSYGVINKGLCLPSGTNLTDDNFDRIFAVLDHVFQVSRKLPVTRLARLVPNDYAANTTIIASPPLKNAPIG